MLEPRASLAAAAGPLLQTLPNAGQLCAGGCSAGMDAAGARADAGTTTCHAANPNVSVAVHASTTCTATASDSFSAASLPTSHVRRCLEVGCGSGYVICSVALALQHTKQATGSPRPAATAGNIGQRQGPSCTATGCSFVATDINPAALQATAATLQAHGVRPACNSSH